MLETRPTSRSPSDPLARSHLLTSRSSHLGSGRIPLPANHLLTSRLSRLRCGRPIDDDRLRALPLGCFAALRLCHRFRARLKSRGHRLKLRQLRRSPRLCLAMVSCLMCVFHLSSFAHRYSSSRTDTRAPPRIHCRPTPATRVRMLCTVLIPSLTPAGHLDARHRGASQLHPSQRSPSQRRR